MDQLQRDAHVIDFDENFTKLVDTLTNLLLIHGSRSAVAELIESALISAEGHYDAERSGRPDDMPDREIFVVTDFGAAAVALAELERPAFCELD